MSIGMGAMIYFDNSASSYYKPPSVVNAMTNALKFLPANAGRSGHSEALKGAALVQKTRERMAFFVTAGDGDVVFTAGCTAALNLAIFGSVRRGGHVITTVREHNSVLRPLYELRRRGLITLSVADKVTAEEIGKLVRPETYMIVTNHVSNVNGEVAPVKEIGWLCREKGLIYLVDGAQSVGYLPVDMTNDNIDMLAVAPHKGLHAAQGAGALVASKRVSLRPVIFGGTGTASHELIQPSDRPDGLEAGTLPLPAIASLCAALKWADATADKNRDKIASLYSALYDGAKRIAGLEIYSRPIRRAEFSRSTSLRSHLPKPPIFCPPSTISASAPDFTARRSCTNTSDFSARAGACAPRSVATTPPNKSTFSSAPSAKFRGETIVNKKRARTKMRARFFVVLIVFILP